eukprot:5527145-Prymnesium_polylepis.3
MGPDLPSQQSTCTGRQDSCNRHTVEYCMRDLCELPAALQQLAAICLVRADARKLVTDNV